MKGRAAIALAGFVVTSLFFIDLCNFIYACGCASLWAGADAHCNVHQASASMHCPACSHGMLGYAAIFGAIVVPQSAVALFLKRGSWMLRLALVLLLFPVIGSAVMTAAGLVDHYPVNRIVFRSRV